MMVATSSFYCLACLLALFPGARAVEQDRSNEVEAGFCTAVEDAGEGACSEGYDRESTVLQGLRDTVVEAIPRADLSRPVALGLVACWDVIVDALELMEALGDGEDGGWAPPQEHAHHDEVGSLQDLGELLAYFLVNGAAAERYVSDKDIFRRLVDAALLLPSHSKTVGGNAAIMALRMVKEGATNVTLGMPGTEALAREFTSRGIEVCRPSEGTRGKPGGGE
ncbi:unnamed protein product, partial [Discosporangium mesarthrocarpum]